MRVIHLADIHWRGLSRHEEYRKSFSNFIELARDLKPDIIYIGGDIVHSKTQGISPELIDSLSWWFSEMSNVAPLHIILGNHDGLIHNKNRQDAITPIISALDDPDIYLYKKSGVYPIGIPGFNWCVFSCFDEESWDHVAPVPGDINIALFHGGVLGSKTDINWNIEGEVTVDFFDGYDFAMLGDIHKLQYLDKQKRIAYPGSSIQQNYGEDSGKGFLLWDIRSKDDFTSTFYEIPHDRPFVTIDWQHDVSSTIAVAKQYMDGSRFRIRSKSPISQEDVRTLQSDLKRIKKATEVVFKCESSFDSSKIKIKDGVFQRKNLRDSTVQKQLIREYYSNNEISKEVYLKFDDLIEKYLSQIAETDSVLRNVRWHINRMKFDNLFAYGEGNVINFDNLPGITGIFGKNARGKSSIVGSLMYGLYNTTDRGTIKNIHIVNSRKNSCNVKIDLTINGDPHRVDRKTVKHQTRKGDVYASTAMSFFRLNSQEEIETDLSDEQRRKTEKVLRRKIGSSEDFLMTSLASQGQMNTFIKERATARKIILSKFLDLEVFEKMYEKAKEDSSELRSKIRLIPDIDWDSKIDDLKFKLQRQEDLLSKIEKEIFHQRETVQKLSIELGNSNNPGVITKSEIESQKNIIKKLRSEKKEHESDFKILQENIEDKKQLVLKIRLAKSEFSIEDFKNKLDLHRTLEKKILTIRHEHENQKKILNDQKKSVKILSEVPCGDEFPSCKFIKDSHKNKSLIEDQKSKVDKILSSLNKNKRLLDKIDLDEIDEKIKKFERLERKLSSISLEISRFKLKISEKNNEIESLQDSINFQIEKLEDMKMRVADDDSEDLSTRLRSRIVQLKSQITDADSKRTKIIDKVARAKIEISRIQKEKAEHKKIKNELRVFDMFIQSVSKKGIPLQIMMTQLPVINSEIEKILQGVVGFTVELEADADSNSMDVYINYGDSRRIIELASGM